MSVVLAIHPENPQQRNIQKATELILQGKVVVLPTDSGYCLACTLENKSAMERITRIRNIDKNHNFTLLCASLSEVSTFAHVDNAAFKIIKKCTPGPFTFILKATKEVPRRLMNEKRKDIGIRIPSNAIMRELLSTVGSPLMSVSLILPGNEVAENNPYEIEEELGNQVDLIVDGGYLEETPTTVVNMVDDVIEVIREGSGDISLLDI